MACTTAMFDDTLRSGRTCMVSTLHYIVAHTRAGLKAVLISVEVFMERVVNTIIIAATFRIWYTFPTTLEKARLAKTAFLASF